MSKLLTVCRRIAACLIFLAALEGHAQRFARIIEAHPIPRAPRRTCQDLFMGDGSFQTVDTLYTQNEDAKQKRILSPKRSESIEPIVRKVLNEWVAGRDYTAEQAEMLWGRDQALEPRRTTYFHLENEGQSAILRVFDGSNTVLSGGTVWDEASASNNLSPLEINAPGFVLPEHRNGNPFWEISLLNVDRGVRSGVDVLLGHVGDKLDLHYNDKEFSLLGSTKTIESRHMMIYAQTRMNRVEIFKKYGFQPVMVSDANGISRPFEITKNCVWMYAKAEDFLRQHYRVHLHIRGKRDERGNDQADRAAYQKDRNKIREHIERIENSPLNLRTPNEAMAEFQKVFQIYLQVRLTTGQSAERRDRIIDFFESYLRLLSSLPPEMRDARGWVNIRNVTRECLSQSTPFAGLYYFSKAMNQASGAVTETSDADQMRFYSVIPNSEFKLILPTYVTAALSWRPY